jgi:hypothetical protein
MVKGLKVAMIVWAAVPILIGLAFIFFPRQLGEMMGVVEGGPIFVLHILALLGVSHIAVGAFVIAAAVRGPLKHIMWVQFAITLAVLVVVVMATSIMRGLVTFRQEGGPLIFNAVCAVALLALYPWRAKPSS